MTATNGSDISKECIWYAKYLKLAAAIAVIRCRPPGLTGQEYAEILISRFQQSQLGWKDEIRRMEKETLLMRQTILQHQLCSLRRDDQTDSDELIGIFHTPPSSVAKKCDSGSTKDDVEEQGSNGQVSPDSIFDRRDSLKKHVSFLQNFLTIDSVQLSATNIKELESVQLLTVEEALNSTVDWLCHNAGPDGVSSELSTHEIAVRTVETISTLADRNTKATVSQKIHDLVIGAIRKLIYSIVDDEKINRNKCHQQICAFITILARAATIRRDVLLELFKSIVDVSRMLANASRGLVQFEPHKLENICHVFGCVEKILTSEQTVHGLSTNTPLLEELRSLANQSLLHISEHYPLFAYYVWHIGGIVDELRTKTKPVVDEF